MTWITQPLEIADANGEGTGRWRMTARSDEGGGGPHGLDDHDHASADEASDCERCDEYCSRLTGFPSQRAVLAQLEAAERAEYERLKAKFNPPPPPEPPIPTLDEQFAKLRDKFPTAEMQTLDGRWQGHHLVTIRDWALPPGYDRDKCDVFFYVPAGYPWATPQRFYTTEVNRPGFGTPVSVRRLFDEEITGYHIHLPLGAYLWFWKVTAWNPRRDTLHSYALVIKSRLNNPAAGEPDWSGSDD